MKKAGAPLAIAQMNSVDHVRRYLAAEEKSHKKNKEEKEGAKGKKEAKGKKRKREEESSELEVIDCSEA